MSDKLLSRDELGEVAFCVMPGRQRLMTRLRDTALAYHDVRDVLEKVLATEGVQTGLWDGADDAVLENARTLLEKLK